MADLACGIGTGCRLPRRPTNYYRRPPLRRRPAADYRRADGADVRSFMGSVQTRRLVFVGLTDLTLSCAAGPACRSRSGAAVAANDVRRTESRSAAAVTPSRRLRAGPL